MGYNYNAYIGVDGKARKVKDVFIGVNGVAKRVSYGSIGVNGKARSWAKFTMCCFAAGTQILTSLDGKTKPIEQMKTGDSIVSYNIETNESYIAEVKGLIVKTDTTDIAEVTTDNGTILIMNAYHPIYTENGWHSITNHDGYDTLVVGDKVKTFEGWSEIIEINRYQSEPIVTYNLDVVNIGENPDDDSNDAYFANGVVVHNAVCGT